MYISYMIVFMFTISDFVFCKGTSVCVSDLQTSVTTKKVVNSLQVRPFFFIFPGTSGYCFL